ncbi:MULTISPECIES: spore coat protein CotJB [Lysinibacillus]|uniref:spore coat protein CotJB n=1 Tax=Lysinibacillus TaxID=400634 RepID=UPI001FAEB9FF|nr:spore coat protein CotJB [Lysinibacillus sphaericus]
MQAIDFIIYLDTHPNDYYASQQFEKIMILIVNFEKKFGSLMNFGRRYSGYPFK